MPAQKVAQAHAGGFYGFPYQKSQKRIINNRNNVNNTYMHDYIWAFSSDYELY